MQATTGKPDCPLCREDGGLRVWRGDAFRVIRADDPDHPAFYRLVWGTHVAEFGDLSALDRAGCVDALVLVEQALRAILQPTKINLAALGNVVPHLHWHVIARWEDDAHWPQPVWAPRQRPGDARRLDALRSRLPAVDEDLRRRLVARFGGE
jgi:diadenosine tetraphosphate (Ap4A) HIT family hydrolase